jgi:hypothetical protein
MHEHNGGTESEKRASHWLPDLRAGWNMIDGFSNHPFSQTASQGDQKCFNIIQDDR